MRSWNQKGFQPTCRLDLLSDNSPSRETFDGEVFALLVNIRYECAMEFLLLFLAALFGGIVALITNVITEFIKKKIQLSKLKTLIKVDLKHLREKLLFTLYKMITRFGKIDYDFMVWFREQYQLVMPESNEKEFILKNLKELLENKSLDAFRSYVRTKKLDGVDLPKVKLIYIDRIMESIGLLDENDVKSILEIYSQIEFLNQAATNCRDYFNLTFTEMNEHNVKANDDNLERAYVWYSDRSKLIYNKISNLLLRFE